MAENWSDLGAEEDWSDLATEEARPSYLTQAIQSFPYAGKKLWRGALTGNAHIYNTAANATDLLNNSAVWLAQHTGNPDAELTEDNYGVMLEKWLRKAGQQTMPAPDGDTSLPGQIYEGLGSAPSAIAQYMVGTKALGMVPGMAAVDAVSEADKGLTAAGVGAIKGALFGGALKGTEPLSRPLRTAAMAGLGGAQGATEGDVKDAVSNAVVMGTLGAVSPSGPVRFKDLAPKPTLERANTERVLAESKQEPSFIKMERPKSDEGMAGSINLNNIGSTAEIKDIIRKTADANKDFTEARRGNITLEETQAMADRLGMTADDLMKRKVGDTFNAEEITAARNILDQSAEQLFELGRKAKNGSDADVAAFDEAYIRHRAIQEQVSGLATEAGRTLSALRILAAGNNREKAIKDLFERSGGRENIQEIAGKIATFNSPEQVGKYVADSYKPTFGDKAFEFWINGLLSGPQTHATNVLSNSLVSMWTIPETAIAGGVARLRGSQNESVRFGEAEQRAYGMVNGFMDGSRAFMETMRSGEASDPNSKIEADRHRAIEGTKGEIVRLPGRFLMAEDELFKAIAYRQELSALAYRQATKEGLRGKDRSSRTNELLNNPTEDMMASAKEAARYQTFTKDLGPTGKDLQKFASNHKALRVIMPFIRTPVNIAKFAGERTPFALFSPEVRKTLKGERGEAAKDTQIARIVMGSTVGAVTATMASNGLVTGAGPTDPGERAALFATGWQPYSLKIGDTYYAYGRLEPLGMLLGISADLNDIAEYASDAEIEKVASLIMESTSKNLISKTWLSGPASLAQAINDPERYGEVWIQRLAGSTIPTGVAHMARIEDPYLREANSIIESIMARTPGMSERLEYRRNYWGEPIKLNGSLGPDLLSPIYASQINEEKINNEIVRLDIQPTKPRKEIRGVELNKDEWRFYQVKAGSLAKDALSKIVDTPQWDSIPDFEKEKIIRDIFRETRDVAREQTIMMYPGIIDRQAQQMKEIYSNAN